MFSRHLIVLVSKIIQFFTQKPLRKEGIIRINRTLIAVYVLFGMFLFWPVHSIQTTLEEKAVTLEREVYQDGSKSYPAKEIQDKAKERLSFPFKEWPFQIPFWLTIVISVTAACMAYRICVAYENRSFDHSLEITWLEFELGYYACMCGIIILFVCLLAGAIIIMFDTNLINPWDIGYLVMLSLITAAGGFYHIYFGYPFEKWGFLNKDMEANFLKLDHEEQKTLLATTAGMVVKFIAGIIIAVLVMKYRKYLLEEKPFTVFHRWMLCFNVLQAVFLIVGVHIHMASKYLWRMEQAKLRLAVLSQKIEGSNPESKTKKLPST